MIKIGNSIKNLRKQKGLTQEELAAVLNVSFQAVSKWENDISYPDVALLPSLAKFFNVTIDELFYCDKNVNDERIKGICKHFFDLYEIAPEEAKKTIDEALYEFPDNSYLLNCLLYVISYNSEPELTIKIAEKILKQTDDIGLKYNALRFSGYAYKSKGDYVSAKAAIEQIPEMYFSKLTELAYLTEGKEKFDAADKQKWISAGHLLEMMWKIAEYFKDSGDLTMAIEEAQKALSIIKILDNSLFDNFNEFFDKQIKKMQS